MFAVLGLHRASEAILYQHVVFASLLFLISLACTAAGRSLRKRIYRRYAGKERGEEEAQRFAGFSAQLSAPLQQKASNQ